MTDTDAPLQESNENNNDNKEKNMIMEIDTKGNLKMV